MALPRALAAGLSLLTVSADGADLLSGDDAVSLVQQQRQAWDVSSMLFNTAPGKPAPEWTYNLKNMFKKKESEDEEPAHDQDKKASIDLSKIFYKTAPGKPAPEWTYTLQSLFKKKDSEVSAPEEKTEDQKEFDKVMVGYFKVQELKKNLEATTSAAPQISYEGQVGAESLLTAVKQVSMPREETNIVDETLDEEARAKMEKAEFESVILALSTKTNIPLPRRNDPNVIYALPREAKLVVVPTPAAVEKEDIPQATPDAVPATAALETEDIPQAAVVTEPTPKPFDLEDLVKAAPAATPTPALSDEEEIAKAMKGMEDLKKLAKLQAAPAATPTPALSDEEEIAKAMKGMEDLKKLAKLQAAPAATPTPALSDEEEIAKAMKGMGDLAKWAKTSNNSEVKAKVEDAQAQQFQQAYALLNQQLEDAVAEQEKKDLRRKRPWVGLGDRVGAWWLHATHPDWDKK